jgi:hypothetical protein
MAYRPVQYEVDSTLTRSETGFDLTVGGAFGIQASIGGGFSFAERSSATVEEGVWALGQHFPNKRYEKLPGLKTSYKDVVGELIQDLRPNWWDSALSFAEEIVNPNSSSSNLTKAADSTYSYQIGDNGTTAVFDRDAVPATVDSIQGVSWGWWGAKTSTTARDLGQEERALKAKVKAAAEEQQGMRYGIGGFYRLRPLGTDLQAPAEITIHYSEEELGDVDEEELSVYWENTEEGTWEYVGGTVDPDSNTVTARIDTFRTFTLAPSLPSGSFDLEPGSPKIQADDTSEVSIESTALSSNDGSSIQDGALYTVGTDLGRVASPDADTTRPGTQVRAENGKITFSVESSRTLGTSDLSA